MIHKPAQTPNASSEFGMLLWVQDTLRLGFVGLRHINLFKLMLVLFHVAHNFSIWHLRNLATLEPKISNVPGSEVKLFAHCCHNSVESLISTSDHIINMHTKQCASSELSYRPPNARRTRTVARQREPRKDLIDKAVGETRCWVSKQKFPKNDKEVPRDFWGIQEYFSRARQYESSRNVNDHRRNTMPDVLPSRNFWTHFAHVDKQIQEQMIKLRNNFSLKENELVAATALSGIKKRVTISRVPTSKIGRCPISSTSSFKMYHQRKSRRKRPYCERTKKRTRPNWRTYNLKQTTAGGTDTVATSKHPDLPKAQKWHREHFRRQGSNNSTQPQISSSQCQDWSGWQECTDSSSSSKRW